ncbi:MULTISPECIES: hypothetical protein [unclassified Rhodococcus (in: high G+C Gram-positive bacteria)]|uniref:hypothetical protein n=1 Tax=unclassified Rhodococcus (in: high G+C Gram-positive bacteria) TaxID=192944 RepID=UPI00158371CD|nr:MULTISPECIES: hypothetical protein [unclassified Rhodococcus (in: high G+C Gram-positive bacteria)]QKT13339.1 hypothetical protein HUN07_23720 [Rhodococcus sp. W8901]
MLGGFVTGRVDVGGFGHGVDALAETVVGIENCGLGVACDGLDPEARHLGSCGHTDGADVGGDVAQGLRQSPQRIDVDL